MMTPKRQKITENGGSQKDSNKNAVQVSNPDDFFRRLRSIPLETRVKVLECYDRYLQECAVAEARSLTDDRYNIKLRKVLFCLWYLHRKTENKTSEESWRSRISLIRHALNIGNYVNSPVISKSPFTFDGRPYQRPVEGESGFKNFDFDSGSFDMKWKIQNLEYPTTSGGRRQEEIFSSRPLVRIHIGYDQTIHRRIHQTIHQTIHIGSDGVGSDFDSKHRYTLWGGKNTEVVVIDSEHDENYEDRNRRLAYLTRRAWGIV